MKDKLKHFLCWIWDECKDVKTLLLFILVVIVMYFPAWGGYCLHLLFGWGWCSAVATAYLVFWAGPFTPFFPLCIAITLGIKRLIEKCKKPSKEILLNKKENGDE